MQIMRPDHLTDHADTDHVAVFETDDHEEVVIEGSSKAEIEAKIADLLVWAS